ncbi:MAG: DUF3343 domain-containing protein [Bacillota bacterium]|nr:DUF3343 domain-containing protein [Bacillota bacterium]
MDCLAVLISGNFAFRLCRIFESKGLIFEVVATPCQISKGGCGYCLKFPEAYKDSVIREGLANNIRVLEIYRIIPGTTHNRYERIY